MGKTGKIVKLAGGTMTDIARGDINYYGKNINSYAAISVNETGKEGVFFGSPIPAEPMAIDLEPFEYTIYHNPVFKTKAEIAAAANAPLPSIINPEGETDEEEKPKKCIIEFSVKNSVINEGTFGFDKILSNYNDICESNIQNLENEYNPFQVQGERYFPPWVSIRVGQTIVLKLDKTFNRKDEYLSVALEANAHFTYRYMKGNTEVTDMIDAKEVHITCLANNQSPDGTLIKVKADGDDAGGINIWYPRPKTIDLQWYFIEITGDDKDEIRLGSKLEFQDVETLLKKGLDPALIDINITNNVANIVDLSAENAELKRRGVLKKSETHNYIESNRKGDFVATVRRNHIPQNNIVTLYLVNRSCLVTNEIENGADQFNVVAGFSPTGTGVAYGILDEEKELLPTAIMHEVMHALGLPHTFGANALHTFEDKKTKNYMDYNETKKYTWKWQWTRLHTYQHLQ